jgi:hypothetical protein
LTKGVATKHTNALVFFLYIIREMLNENKKWQEAISMPITIYNHYPMIFAKNKD